MRRGPVTLAALQVAARLARGDALHRLAALVEGRERVSARRVAAALEDARKRLRADAVTLRVALEREDEQAKKAPRRRGE